MGQDKVVITRAAEHNLKNVSLEIPRDTLAVFTGVSGSGKTSLAFDTVFKEGMRRFVESLSAYARQFMGKMGKPRVERVEGLSPTVSIDQKTVSRNPRSTVGTVTEIYDHLRLLFARLGTPHCPECGKIITSQSPDQIVRRLLASHPGRKAIILAPVVHARKGEYRKELSKLREQGYVRVRVDGEIRKLDEEIELARYEYHTIEVVIDRVELRKKYTSRITEAVEGAVNLAEGKLTVLVGDDAITFSTDFGCADCGVSLPEMEPRLFSFNSPHGACPACLGIGRERFQYRMRHYPYLLKTRLGGTCPNCEGRRLKPEALAVSFRDRNIAEVSSMTVGDAFAFFGSVVPDERERKIGREIFRELVSRLSFLVEVGLDYLTLDRPSRTLAGGEAQRIRLAGQVGSRLRGVLYVLDEPSIGLHARDQRRLLATLRALRDRGNTVFVVEHDEETIRAADHVVDVGPLGGKEGGEIVAQGTFSDVSRSRQSVTGAYISGERAIPLPFVRRKGSGKKLTLKGVSHHNLKNIDVSFPLGCLVVVTGVSGSGKSSLVTDVLHEALKRDLNRGDGSPGYFRRMTGLKNLDKVIQVDQSPIGRTPRSNPATYTKVMDHIRDLFASLEESRVRGYKKGRFSFNVKGGRCEACGGAGVVEIEMQFLANVHVACEECEGRRYNDETLEIKYKGNNIRDVLEMTVAEAREFFANVPKIRKILDTLHDVGLGYVPLGQPSTTLSGGEAQRVKLASELRKKATGRTLYILDEPTTGLHFDDVAKLLASLNRLVEMGNTVVVIEHNMEIIKCADHLIDLGPEGGDAGGRLVAQGTPEEVARCENSHTGRVLRETLGIKKKSPPMRPGKRNSRTGGDIKITGAEKNNLKHVSVRIPENSITCVTGVSGSGKTSLVFDTLFSEGQRRFVESMSTYARRFLGRLDRPPVEKLEGLRPSIAIDQKSAPRNPRSTVATVTEIYDYLRLLYARIGRQYCPECGEPLESYTPTAAARKIVSEYKGTRGRIMAPLMHPGLPVSLPVTSAGELEKAAGALKARGYARLVVNGDEIRIDETDFSKVKDDSKVFLVIDRLAIKKSARKRAADSLEQAFERGRGLAAFMDDSGVIRWFPGKPSCVDCAYVGVEEISPRMFSFNSHVGACETCDGLGMSESVDPRLLIAAPHRKLLGGAFTPSFDSFLTRKGSRFEAYFKALARETGTDIDRPWNELPESFKRVLLFGYRVGTITAVFNGRRRTLRWRGLVNIINGWFTEHRDSPWFEEKRDVLAETACPDCGGARLKKKYLYVKIGGRSISELTGMTVTDSRKFVETLDLSKRNRDIAEDALREVESRLDFLADVGLEYLSLDRKAGTLSGGEAQRIRLASQIGNRLVGVLYALDEPTIGLHPRDTGRLIDTLTDLRDLGNTVVIVEHDETTIRAADQVIDMGPGAGERGGRVVAEGTAGELEKNPKSLTGQCLSGKKRIPTPTERRFPLGRLEIKGAREHNLKNIDVNIPLGVMTVVTGVSGSGKSTLVLDVLERAARQKISGRYSNPGRHDEISGLGKIDRVLVVDQGPIGRNPNSTPASYTGVMDKLRVLFSRLPESKMKGFGPGRFSFNAKSGRCPVCDGKGAILMEMHFLSDVWITCDACKGKRYNDETLLVRYKGKNIADVLEMEISEAREFFANVENIRRTLAVLDDVGLGYVRLGQTVRTLSGGELQRIKLATELSKRPKGRTLYLFDEPTTGLHMDDVSRLLGVIERLVNKGNTAVIIEHNMDVIRRADYVVDLGPGGGDAGGEVVAEGTPEEVAKTRKGYTAMFLKTALKSNKPKKRKKGTVLLRPVS